MDADLEGAAFGCRLWPSAALPADDAERVRVRRSEERDSSLEEADQRGRQAFAAVDDADVDGDGAAPLEPSTQRMRTPVRTQSVSFEFQAALTPPVRGGGSGGGGGD